MTSGGSAGRREVELKVLTRVAKALATPAPLPELLQAVMQQVSLLLGRGEYGLLLLWDPSEGLFRPQATCGEGLRNPSALSALALRRGEAITGKVFETGKSEALLTEPAVRAWMADMQPQNREAFQAALGEADRPRSVVAAPLAAEQNRYGVLLLANAGGDGQLTVEDLPVVESLAELIALAIHRSRVEEESVAAREVELAGQLRAEALATLSHELRTPLAAIKGYATALLLEEVEWAPEKHDEFLRQIDAACDYLESMITDILDSSLIDIGRLTLEVQPIRLAQLAQEVADETQRRSELHHLALDMPPDLPLLEADPRRIKQVIRNILDNALKYSPEGGLIMIRAETRPQDVVVSISDQGVGISPEDLIPLFEKYFRVKSPTGYHVPGTGLGLPVARAIVEAHGGRIWAESKVGEGTTLSFSLPRRGLAPQPVSGEE
jgi:signal transduction histidine kinase